jgi:malate dehydrogenase (oxaloacetate-decarboxylating)
MGAENVIMCDTKGAIYKGRSAGMNPMKELISELTNKSLFQGSLGEALENADVFIGVSAAGAVSSKMVQGMNKDAIIFAMANPDPEIMPEEQEDQICLIKSIMFLHFRGFLKARCKCMRLK